MHFTINNLKNIKNEINLKINSLNLKNYNPKIVAVSKTFKIDHLLPLIDYGHYDFGENKVQEAIEKWSEIKNRNSKIKLHMVGKLQTNKVKYAIKIFDYIHSLDNLKLAEKISSEQKKNKVYPKIFIQINIGNEIQKSGISKKNLKEFYKACKLLDLNIIGTMCLPPEGKNPKLYFKEMNVINKNLNLNDLSMGMSQDYLEAIDYSSTFLRIGSKIFGPRI